MMTNPPKTIKPTDPRSPFYLISSDNTGNIITIVKLNGNNYENWAKSFKNALKARNKLGFIDGTITQPLDTSDEAYFWVMINSLIVSWIHNTIDPVLEPSIPYFYAAKDLWDVIKQRFDVGNGPRMYQLQYDLNALKQQGMSVTEYYNKLRHLWDALDAFAPIPTCTCGSSCATLAHLHKMTNMTRLFQFWWVLMNMSLVLYVLMLFLWICLLL